MDAHQHAIRRVLLTLAVLLIVVVRSPEAVLAPSMEAEDGTFVFPYYYAHRDAASLLRFQAGYVPLTLNAIAYLAVRLPTRVIPYGFGWLPMALALTACTWLFDRRFGRWLGGDVTRAFICVLFVLAPLAQYHVYANATYSIWNALLLLVLLVLTPPSPGGWKNFLEWATTNVLVWSNPLSVVAAPIVMVRLVREPHRRLMHALTIVNMVIYNVVGVEKGGIFLGLTWFESLVKVVDAVGWMLAIAAGITFRTVVGAALFGWAEVHSRTAIGVWAVLVALVVCAAAVRSRPLRPVFGVISHLVLGFTFVSVLSRGASTLVPLNQAPRYIYVPTIGVIVILVLLLEHLLIRDRPRLRPISFALVTTLYVALNAQLGPPPNPYAQSGSGNNGGIVRDFFKDLDALERRNGSRSDIYLRADKVADWPMIADTRGGS